LAPIVVPSDGLLPLRGPGNNVDPRVRPPVQRLPTLDAWNATLQRQLTSTMNIELAYIGNKGTHVFAGNGPAYNANEAAIGPVTDGYVCSPIASGANAGKFDCKQQLVALIPTNNRRRFFLNGVPSFTAVGEACCATDVGNYFGNDASSHYEAFQVKVEKRFSQGLQFLAHYTYSHAYNYDSNYYSADARFAYGSDDFSRNHVFVLSAVYELPVGRGKRFLSDAGRALNLIVGGWQVSSTTNWSGGLPFTATINECGQISDVHTGSGDVVCRPDLLPGKSFSTGLHRDSSGNLRWFTPVASLSQNTLPEIISATDVTGSSNACTLARPTSGPFALPACSHIGNAGRNWLRGPHAFASDLSVSKNFNITEKYVAQFRFDAYNVFNHPILGFGSTQGNTCVDCAGGGIISSIEADASPNAPNGMRQLQFGLRFTF